MRNLSLMRIKRLSLSFEISRIRTIIASRGEKPRVAMIDGFDKDLQLNHSGAA